MNIGSFIRPRLALLARTHDLPIALGLLLICFITRLIAFPASLWEWDDILFARALHQYNLSEHSPHPPGFPVFVAMARVAYWILKDEHLALSTVSLIFTSLLAPALFYFYREVFCDRRIALAGALLGSFAPNIWVHSGAGRSDGVALTFGIIGLTLVIHGLQSSRSLIAGCAVFGIAMGVRVTLLPVMGPVIALVFLIRLWRREWRPVAAALGVGSIFILLWFVPFIYLVSWRVFNNLMKAHSEYAWNTDSIFANNENGLLPQRRLERFFIEVWGARWIMLTIYLLSLLGLTALAFKRRWKTIGWMALSFFPFIIFTLVLNTPLSAPLYSLPYIPLFIGLAACGLIMVPSLYNAKGAGDARKNVGLFLAVVLTIGIGKWTYPVIKLLHSEESPPVRAFHYLKQKFDPKRDVLNIEGYFLPHTIFYMPEAGRFLYNDEAIPETNLIRGLPEWPRFIGLTCEPLPGEDREHFGWTADNRVAQSLRRLSLGRYFDAYVSDISKMRGVIFLSGWYNQESGESRTWRWMGREGKVGLLGIAESMILRLQGAVAISPEFDHKPIISIRFNGVEVDRFTPGGSSIDRTLVLKPDAARQWSVLSIETDQTFIPRRVASSPDDRELGIQCFSLEWSPAPGTKVMTQLPDHYLGTGWYGLENNKDEYGRWTNGSAIAHLPAVNGDARLDLKMLVPQRTDGTITEVTVEVGGNLIDKFKTTPGNITKTYYVPESMHHSTQTELKLSAPVFSTDPKPRAIMVNYLGWRPSGRN
jgi:hypothetical protein